MQVSANQVIENEGIYVEFRNMLRSNYGRAFSREFLVDQLMLINSAELNENLKKIEAFIDEHFDYPILFLPTYRRIEQDIKTLYPELVRELKQVKEDSDIQVRDRRHIELIKFGMEDVESIIQKMMNHFKEDFRSSLENLMGTYLKDILDEKHKDIKIEEIKKISEKLDLTLQRIDEKILSKREKGVLRQKIDIITSGNTISGDEYVVAHFLSKLSLCHFS
jgi:hypothetical protein